MTHLSANGSPTTLRTTWIIALAGLALLAGGLAIADDASAANVQRVQTYIWGNTTDANNAQNPSQAVDSLNHSWVPVPHEDVSQTDFSSNVTVIPEDGLLLVGVDYDATSEPAEYIRFRLVEESTLSQDDPTEHVYEYVIDGSPSEEDQNVWLANGSVPIQPASSSNPNTYDYRTAIEDNGDGSTGENGCGSDGDAPLAEGPGATRSCWFLIELQNPDDGLSDGTPTASSSTDYVMEVAVRDGDGEDILREEMDTDDDGDLDDPRSLTMAGSSISSVNARFTSRTIDTDKGTTIEADRTATLNLSVETDGSVQGRSTDWGDVDAWLCAFEDDEANDPDDPYTGFAELHTSPADLPASGQWDSPAACEFMNFPTHDGSGKANAINFTDVEIEDDTGHGDNTRYFRATFTIDASEMELSTSEFNDQFFFRVIIRDPIGNIDVRDQTSSDPGEFTVARFDVSQDLQEFTTSASDLENQTFRDNEGCFQVGDNDNPPAASFSNSADEPCFIGLNYAPPDQTFTFPVQLVNYANVQDKILVEWDDPDDPGQTNWDVTIEHDGTDDQSHVVSVPAAAPQPTDGGTQVNRDNVNPGTTEVLVKVTPVSKALAGPTAPTTNFDDLVNNIGQGFRTVQVEASSERGNEPATVERFVQAQLVQNAQGGIELGPNGDREVTLETKTEEFNETTLTVRNTGNTNGPFDVELASTASDRCHDINQDTNNDDSDIEIDLFRSGSTEVPSEGVTVAPGQTRDLTVRVRPGTSVPVGSYDCELTFTPDPDGDGGDPVSLVTTDPTVVVDVVGTPDIEIWDVRGVDDDQVNVTGKELTVTVPPHKTTHDLFLYLENVGDVTLEPRLVSVTDEDETFLVSDRFGLGGTWRGVDQAGDQISQSTMASGFDLPVSDADETENVRIRELFDLDNRDIASGASDESTGDRWYCAGKDSAADTEDDEPRVVCQLHLQYDFSTNPAVKGDRVVHKFKWADTGGVGDPSQLTVRLKFRHPGTVETTSVTEKVLANGEDTTIEFDAGLTDAHRFDPDANDVDANLQLSFDGTDCSFQSGTDDVTSTSESLRSATFRVDVSATDDGTSPCEVDVGGDGTFNVLTDGAGTLNAAIDVEDENGTLLRQVHPASITFEPSASGSVAGPSSFDLGPSDELDADGAQFARVLFDAGADGSGFPDAGEGEGMLLTRKSSGNALEPFPTCSLGGDAVVTDEASLTWTVLQADGEPADLAFDPDGNDEQNTIDAGTDIGGLLIDTDQSGSEDEPIVIGDATLWGWDGDDNPSNGLNWTEGWNPLVMRLADADGDPARVGDASNAVDVELDLRFQVRDTSNGNVTDTYELSTDDGTIQVQSVGNGMFRVDVYLPATISDHDLPSGSGFELADYNGTDNVDEQSVRYEAFALHARVSNGQSTGGDDLDGDVYWQLGDLGIVHASSPASNVGTVGASQVAPGIHDASTREQLTDQRVSDDDQVEYLHAAPRFLEPLMQERDTRSADWVTGPGAQDYTVFLMEESSQPRDSPSGFAEENVADGFREHTFSPYTNGDVDLIVDGNARLGVPGGESYALEPAERDGASTDGLYSTFFVLPDTGQESFTWFTHLNVDEDQQDAREFFNVIRTVRVDESLEPSANGLPMPLCLRTPADAFDEGDEPAGDFDLDDRDIRTIADLRTVPGLLVDRGDFAMAPLIDNGNGRVHFDVNQDATFSVLGQSLLSLDQSQLPSTGETDVPVTLAVSPTPTSAVNEVTARLSQDGDEIDTATLSDGDGDGVYRGSVVSAENGTHTLRVTATDTAGATAIAESEVSIEQNQPPSITIARPSATDGERAMPSDGTVEATITDRSIFPEAITLEEKIGSSDGGGTGTPLSDSEVSFESLTDEPVEGQHSVTLTFENVETGTAHVNVTDMEGVNFSAPIQDNSTSGTIQFNTTGPATVTVETNGTDGVSTQFSVTVGSTGGDSFTEVDLGSDAISCEDTSCTLTHAPSGLSDGDTYTFRIVANVSEDDKNSKGPVDVTVDDQAPTVSISIGSPKASGSPTRVGTRTSITVEAEDNVLVQSVVLGARKGGVETGTQSFQGGDASVTGEVSSLSQLGLDSSGTASLNATVTDIAGNEEVTQVDVRIDGEGPSLSGASIDAAGSGLEASVSASDPAGLDVVQLRVKKPGETSFSGKTMQEASGGEYTATVSSPGSSGTLEYYFRATDNLGNEETLGSESNPRTFDLGDVQLENAPPEVTILAPGADAEVSGTFDLELEVSDEDAGDTVEIESVLLTPSSGSDVPVEVPDGGTTTIPVNTTGVAEGRTILEVEVTDGTDTASAQRTVFVDNLLNPCEDSPTVSGGEVTFCLAFTPDGNASDVAMELIRNGETIATASADCDGSTCRATFPAGDVPANSPVRPDLVVSSDDGTSQRHEGEIQSIGSAVAPPEPLGRFVTTLVLAVLTMGAAAYAGFRRWG